ncbi:Vacuolar amino acid transporter 5 [Dictyocoela muelleri]|nr:Vacuolar amino acid transporter 5 [Dictyocoela muelleri]
MFEDIAICINLLKTIIGGGILYFPMLFITYGWLFTVCLSILASLLSIFGLSILSLCSIKNKGSNVTISSLAHDCIPKLRFIVDFFVFFKCFGVSIAYLIIAKQTFKRVLINLYGQDASINVITKSADSMIASNLIFQNTISKDLYLAQTKPIPAENLFPKNFTPTFLSTSLSNSLSASLLNFFSNFKTQNFVPNFILHFYNLTPANTVHTHSIPDERIILFIFLCMISPFTFFKKLTNLKYTSFLGIFSVLIVLLSSIYRFFTTEIVKIKMIEVPTYPWLRGIGSFIFSFTCHHNLMSLQNEMRREKNNNDLEIINSIKRLKVINCNEGLRNLHEINNKKIIIERPTLSRMLRIITFCISFSLIFYLSFGYVNASLYAHQMHDNIIESMPSDNISTFVFILYIFVMGFSYPLQINPCRLYFLNMVGIHPKYIYYNFIFNIVTVLLIVVTYFVAVSGIDLGIVYAFIGSSASVIICLILPPIYFFKMNFSKNVVLRGICFFLLGIGLLVMFSMCLYYLLGV